MGINKIKRSQSAGDKTKLLAKLVLANKKLVFENRKKERDVLYLKNIKEKLAYYKRLVVVDYKEPIIIQDFNGIIKGWNKASEKVYGFKEKEMLGKSITKIIAREDQAAARSNINKIKQGKPSFRSKQTRITKDKRKIFLNITYSPIYETGEIIEVAKTEENITARLRAAEQVAKRAAELAIANKKLAFDNREKAKRAAELAIANKKLAFDNREKAKRAEELAIANVKLAYENKEKAKRAAELEIANKKLAFDNREKAKRAEELAIANKKLAYENKEKAKRAAELEIANIKLVFENKEKAKRAAELAIANKKLAYENKEKAKRAAELEIANKKLAYENKEKAKRVDELAFSNTILSTQQETSIDGILVVDENGTILSYNQHFLKMWDIATGTIKIKSDKWVLRPVVDKVKNPEEFTGKITYLRKTQDETSRDELALKDGRIFDCYSAPMFDDKKIYHGRVWYFRDITKEKEIDRAKSEFISVASHQLKTPLAGIKWISELLLGDKIEKPSDKQKEFLSDIHFSNERMINLVDSLLNISHIETGKGFDIVKKKTDVMEIISEVLKENKQLAIKKNASVINKCPDSTRKILLSIDGDKIKQVFGNLINNAIKYSDNKGKVEIGCANKNKEIIFRIKNGGMGIPQEQQKKVFEKFFRADNASAQEADGTGLGLYIAKAIATAHGGKLWFESVENKETIFYFSLPIN